MVVSSNTLFHFTKKYATLLAILESKGFWPKYCVEEGWQDQFAVPESCFCDIPLSGILPHIKKYGSYGLGMSKVWGKEKGLSPVLYYLKGSGLAKEVNKLLGTYKKDARQCCSMRFLAYVKVYGIKRESDGGGVETFYNEREWRYVPSGVNKVVTFDCSRKNLEKLSEESREHMQMCKFNYGDVKYIIVDTENEREILLNDIRKMVGQEAPEDGIRLLCSKIVTCDFIKEDI